jgi:transposase
MEKTVKYIGLDVHKNSISIAIADQGRDGEIRFYGKIDHDMDQLQKVFRKFISQGSELRCVYEAGGCGYHLYRYLTHNGIECNVVAPSQIPRKSGDRQKNDKRDCLSLARLHRAGELTAVYVPNEEDEALRDLVRARSDAQNAHKKAKQQLAAFLLRYHIVFSGKSKWSIAYFNWLADISMPHPAQQITLQEYIDTVKTCGKRVDRLTEQIRQLSAQSRLSELIKALQAMRGISLVVAATLASELGDFSRFERADQVMAFLGLIPSEHSSGDKQRKGTITKTGNSHVRKALIEAAQAYRLPARKSRVLQKRQEGVPEKICDIAWKAQCRLCGRYKKLIGRGKKTNVAKTAIARELAGFAWAIAMEPPHAA